MYILMEFPFLSLEGGPEVLAPVLIPQGTSSIKIDISVAIVSTTLRTLVRVVPVEEKRFIRYLSEEGEISDKCVWK